MRQGIKVLCSPNGDAAGKAPLQAAGTVDTKKPKSKKECLEAGKREGKRDRGFHAEVFILKGNIVDFL